MSNELPLISIVTPSYNQAQFLEETILSVLNQDYPRIEYIIIDGGSTDGSVDIIRKYEDRLAYWVSEPDRGQADAINRGWRVSSGDILAWLNSDDTLLPGAISTMVDFLREHPHVDVAYGDARLVDETNGHIGKLRSEEFRLHRLLVTCFIPQPTAFLRRSVLDKIGNINTKLYFVMDYDFWLRAALEGCTFKRIPVTLANFRIWGGSKTQSQIRHWVQELLSLLQDVFASERVPPDLLRFKSQAFSEAMLLRAYGYYLEGRMGEARREVMQAVKLCPAQLLNPATAGTFVKSLLGFEGSRWARQVKRWVARKGPYTRMRSDRNAKR